MSFEELGVLANWWFWGWGTGGMLGSSFRGEMVDSVVRSKHSFIQYSVNSKELTFRATRPL